MTAADTQKIAPRDRRWLALAVLCMGVFMIVIDTTVVTVALPSIKSDLGFDQTTLAWVINAYMLTFGGFLLLGGRLGDLYGHRRWFLIGIALFTFASLACGCATSQTFLIAARAIQGVGGAVVTAVALSLIMDLFTEGDERAKAMGIYSFICAGGGSVGEVLGGVLTSTLTWHSIFLINIPIGAAVIVYALRVVPGGRVQTAPAQLDVAGAVTVTTSLLLAVYAIMHGGEAGWTSTSTLGLLGVSIILFAAFLAIESRVRAPLMPLGLFRLRNLAIANAIGILWVAAMFGWFFLSALYMQLVLGYNPAQVGFAFLPADLIMAAFSLGWSAKIVMRFGIRRPIVAGLLLATVGLALFARAPIDGAFVVDILPAMVLLGLGAGIAFNPVLLAATNDVAPSESGLASGIVNTSFMLGGALGLAALASLAAVRTAGLIANSAEQLAALRGGYSAAFVVGAIFAAIAAALAVLLRVSTTPDAAPTVEAAES